MPITRQQMIYSLTHCSDATADRINNRLQRCNVRIVRSDGSTEPNFTIYTTQQLVSAMQNDPSIKSVRYYFNSEWTIAQA